MIERVLRYSTANRQAESNYTRRQHRWSTFLKGLTLDTPYDRKDCGNVVGGVFVGDRRSRENMEFRSMLTLDADYPEGDFPVQVMFLGCAAALYTTYSHTATSPRWRMFAPLSRDATPDEYWRITHAVMHDLGSHQFDDGSAEAERLMHLPSTRGDGSFQHFVIEGEPFDVDAWLARAKALGVEDRSAHAARVDADAEAWLDELPEEEPCRAMQAALRVWQRAVATPGAERYPKARDGVYALLKMHDAGHAGVLPALAALNETWLDQYDNDEAASRPLDNDWNRSVKGALGRVLATPTPASERMCCGLVRDFVVQPVSLSFGAVSGALLMVDGTDAWEASPPNKPDAVADELISRLWTIDLDRGDTCTVLRHWLSDTYEWHSTHWERMPHEHLEAVLQRELRNAYYRKRNNDGTYSRVAWNPTQKSVAGVAAMLRGRTLVHAKIGANHWIDCTDGRCPVGDAGRRYLSFRNGILDLDTGDMYEHVSAFFNVWSLKFAYDPAADCRLWVATLEQWFPGDQEAQDTLEEILGYLVLGDMEMHKFFPFLGRPRSGKGTVMRVLASMLGPAYTTQSMDDLADRFGMEDLLHKTVCHISEAAATQGMRKVVQLIKSIAGEDTDNKVVKRKGQKSVENVPITVRFVMTGNEEVSLPDDSGVIADRMVPLGFNQSYLGKENNHLTEQLIAESDGIFNRIRLAHNRLMERGRFVTPTSSEPLVNRLRASASPIKAWWQEMFEVTGAESDIVPVYKAVKSYKAHVDGHATDKAIQMKINANLPNGVASGERVYDAALKKQVAILRGLRLLEDEPFEPVSEDG